MRHSYFLYLVGRLWVGCCSFEDWIAEFSGDSAVLKSISKFWAGIKVSFEHCFLMRLADSYTPSRFLDESKAVSYFKALYKRWEKHMIVFLEASKIACLSKEIKKEFHVIPVKMGSMILVLSISINISLSIIFKKEISLLNWIIQGLILFAGLGGFSCQADWETIKKNSAVFNKIFK